VTNNQTPTEQQTNDNMVVMKKKESSKVRVFALGGLNEIGKNLYVIEYGDNMIIIDCGVAFPDENMPGIDLVIPDFTYLEKNYDKLRGILLTHGHEDHIGAIPYLLKQVNVPVYGTKLTLGILENKLIEHNLVNQARLVTVSAGDVVTLGCFKAEFIRVNHSIADSCCIAVTTPVGVIFHSGDFKFDVSPIDGEMMDLTRIGEYGRRGVLMLLCESTNVERPGFTPSERKVGQSLDTIFMQNADKRIVIATFSSNVHRVQQIINTSVKFGRKVAVTGRSMVNVINAAVNLGYMTVLHLIPAVSGDDVVVMDGIAADTDDGAGGNGKQRDMRGHQVQATVMELLTRHGMGLLPKVKTDGHLVTGIGLERHHEAARRL